MAHSSFTFFFIQTKERYVLKKKRLKKSTLHNVYNIRGPEQFSCTTITYFH